MLKRFKGFSFAIIILILIIAITGCDSNGVNGDEDFVWNTFNNDYYTFDYPGPWEEDSEDGIAAVRSEDEEQFFIAFYFSDALTDEEEEQFWSAIEESEEIPEEFEDDFMEGFSIFAEGEFEFDSLKINEFNGYTAIEGEGVATEDNIKTNFIIYNYDEEHSIMIYYLAEGSKYSEEIKDRIYNSFQVNL